MYYLIIYQGGGKPIEILKYEVLSYLNVLIWNYHANCVLTILFFYPPQFSPINFKCTNILFSTKTVLKIRYGTKWDSLCLMPKD